MQILALLNFAIIFFHRSISQNHQNHGILSRGTPERYQFPWLSTLSNSSLVPRPATFSVAQRKVTGPGN